MGSVAAPVWQVAKNRVQCFVATARVRQAALAVGRCVVVTVVLVANLATAPERVTTAVLVLATRLLVAAVVRAQMGALAATVQQAAMAPTAWPAAKSESSTDSTMFLRVVLTVQSGSMAMAAAAAAAAAAVMTTVDRMARQAAGVVAVDVVAPMGLRALVVVVHSP